VHTGPVRTVERIRGSVRSARAAGVGALAVDLESAPLAAAAGGLPVAVARVVVDSPDRPLFRGDLPVRGLAALARLPAVGRGLAEWASAVGEREVLLTAARSPGAGAEPETGDVEPAMREVAARVDLVLVFGSGDSTRARHLVALTRRAGTPAHLIHDIHDVQASWLTGAGRIGVGMIAPVPARLVEELLTVLRGLGRCRVREQATATGHVRLPGTEQARP
jgi:hypothetical protein